MTNMPEELQMMGEALIHAAIKYGFAFSGALFKNDDKAPVIMILRNTQESNPAEVFRVLADLIDAKIASGEVINHRIGQPS